MPRGSAAELVAIQRSAAMLRKGQTCALPREQLIELVAEVLEARQLLERLGGELRAVAAKARKLGPYT